MHERKINYLGKHTTIGYLTPAEWEKIPYLKENNGLLPSLIIAAGDSRRVTKAVQFLGLKNVVNLHEEGERLLGPVGRGRVDLIIGEFVHLEKRVPITIVETQMGMPATEIVLKEVFAHCDKNEIYVIRVGTAGGINLRDGSGVNVGIGSIINAEFNIGFSGAIIESLAGLDFFDKKTPELFRKKWTASGGLFTADGKFPMAKNSVSLIEAIDAAAEELHVKSIRAGNFSKDSLYAEMDEDSFIELRKKYNVISTEMEQIVISKLSQELASCGINIHTGLVSGIIGTLPGESFTSNKKQAIQAEKAEETILKIAAIALWKTAQKGS